MTRRFLAPAALSILVLFSVPLTAADDKPADKPAAEKAKKEPPPPLKVVTKHHLKAGDTDLSYSTTAEEVRLVDKDGNDTASFFTTYYVLDGVARPEDRPVTFVFNGGPGSASLWLHLGLVGPKLIDIPSDATDPGAPPYALRDNPSTILRATDLVFIDPVGTGFSHAMGEKKDEDFWGYDQDADSVAEFIRTFITLHGRWNSPKFILGESYGGIRTSLLVPRLQQNLQIGLNGLILISPALNMGTLPFVVTGNDLGYATELPAYASVAYYHHKLPDSWPDKATLLKEVEAFASSEYLVALFKGDRLEKAERDHIAEKLHRYTGLPKEYILRADLRIYGPRFTKELLRDEGKSIGFLDGRYKQDEVDNVAELPDNDPFNQKTGPIYLSTFQSYLKGELGVDWTKRYLPGNGEANQKWKRPANGQNAFSGYVDVTGNLSQGTKDNEALRIFACSGYEDLATTYYALSYTLLHARIDPKRLTIKAYEGGHMMYLYRPSLESLSNDIVSFIRAK
jgi:carboxypeptidase C (cathepsin A)